MKLLKIISKPVHVVSDALHRIKPHNKKHSKCLLGLVLMILAANIASMHQSYIPHFIWDAGAWLIHGLGAAPIINLISGE